MVESGWVRVHGGSTRLRCEEIAEGRFRSPDPWYSLRGKVLVRRLSPDNRKLDLEEAGDPARLVDGDMLHAMGADLAAVHLGHADRTKPIVRDLDRRMASGSLVAAVKAATAFARREHEDWKRGHA